MSEVACVTTERFHEARDLMLELYSSYKAEDEENMVDKPGIRGSNNPKGQRGRKKPQRCSICKKSGHNKTSCSKRKEMPSSARGSGKSCALQEDANYDGVSSEDLENDG
ncbi:hypothetical protein PIB30_112912 [Stylosanthes scabra]|uniref:Uncharacterized protein n=1 Tax=Stylosanthes scabra TaxID=79078 RepID=A0ABU6Y0T3_9FABA|nr:hypothetical protein [Stylosanthes scabra]